MDLIAAMRTYVRVVEAGSFTRAADSLSMQKAGVTKQVQQLEAHLRTRLLHRTTRKLAVTDDGRLYYQRAVRLLEDLEDLESSLAISSTSPRGRLRVDASSSVATLLLAPCLGEFFARYPDIQIDLSVHDHRVDPVAANIDCVIRCGDVLDESLVARRIGTFDFITCASPEYLAARGVPVHPADLQSSRHTLVRYLSSSTGQPIPITFRRPGERHEVEGRYTLAIGDGNAYVAAGLAGLGVIQAPAFMLHRHLQSRRLRPLLQDWNLDPLPVWLAYPPNRHVSARLRAFIDWAVERFSACQSQGRGSALPAGRETRTDAGASRADGLERMATLTAGGSAPYSFGSGTAPRGRPFTDRTARRPTEHAVPG
ncbi:MAG TPA: LysR substrate-binding domain-containing protein [Burkholderiaceae bacterium]|nr:LysR substrate-binding domain-containing protein [Burkholderiaceae bacterium]